MATTPHFAFPTPDDTDLVKDGALAMRDLGDAIDTELYDPTVNTLTVSTTSTLTGVCSATTVIASGSLRTGSRTVSVSENIAGMYAGDTFLSANRVGGIPFYLNRGTGTTSAEMIQFYRNGTAAGTLNASTTAAPTLVSPSDYRLKENITPLTDAADRIKNANVYTYNFIADDTKELRYGFLAHEAADIMEDLVLGEKDAVDDDGQPVYQAIQETRLIPILAAALKDALVTIDTLEARLTALEGKK